MYIDGIMQQYSFYSTCALSFCIFVIQFLCILFHQVSEDWKFESIRLLLAFSHKMGNDKYIQGI